jgi:hypothetical protein
MTRAFGGTCQQQTLEAWRRKLTLDSSIIASEAGWKGTHNAALSQTTGIPTIRLGTEAIVRKRRRERF